MHNLLKYSVLCVVEIADQLGSAGHWGNGGCNDWSGDGTDRLCSSTAERCLVASILCL